MHKKVESAAIQGSKPQSLHWSLFLISEFRPDWTEETNSDVDKSSQVENSDDEDDLFSKDNSANNIKNELMDNDETVEVDVQIDETDDNERLLSTVDLVDPQVESNIYIIDLYLLIYWSIYIL